MSENVKDDAPKRTRQKKEPQKPKETGVILTIRRVGSDEFGNLKYKPQRWTGTVRDFKQFLSLGYVRPSQDGNVVVYGDFTILSEDNIPDGCPTAEEFNNERFNK